MDSGLEFQKKGGHIKVTLLRTPHLLSVCVENSINMVYSILLFKENPFHRTTYLLLPPLSFQFPPHRSSAYRTHCAALPALRCRGVVRSSRWRFVLLSPLISPALDIFFCWVVAPSRVGWSVFWLFGECMGGGGVIAQLFVGRYPSHFETLAPRHLVRLHAWIPQVVQRDDVFWPSLCCLNFSNRKDNGSYYYYYFLTYSFATCEYWTVSVV